MHVLGEMALKQEPDARYNSSIIKPCPYGPGARRAAEVGGLLVSRR